MAQSQAHILLVDDDVQIADLFQAILEGAGYRVSVANDGVQGLELYGRDPADGVVTDYQMPRMNGGEMIARLRERHPDLPVLVLTGYADGEGLAGPNTTVMLKPVSPADVIRRLALMLADAATVRGF